MELKYILLGIGVIAMAWVFVYLFNFYNPFIAISLPASAAILANFIFRYKTKKKKQDEKNQSN